MKIYTIIGAFGGIVDKVRAAFSEERAYAIRDEMDKEFEIKRDGNGRYESDNDVWLEEAEIEDEVSGGKLFLATFYQQDGEFEYDDISFVQASCLDEAVDKCRERLRTWWDGEMRPVDGKADTYEEGEGGYRRVKLGDVIEVVSMRDVIDRIGEIS
jgi:hypothetical protein